MNTSMKVFVPVTPLTEVVVEVPVEGVVVPFKELIVECEDLKARSMAARKNRYKRRYH